MRLRLDKRTKKKLLGLLLALIAVGLGAIIARYPNISSSFTGIPPGMYRVSEFHDGDTISVSMDGKQERIRLIGVDTPEIEDPRKPVQCFGKAASAFTKYLIGNQPIRLAADPLSSNRDRYGRLLRYVYLPDGTLINAEIIKQGYGFAYTSFPFTKSEEFKSYQEAAQTAGRGLWASCQPTQNQYGGYDSNPE